MYIAREREMLATLDLAEAATYSLVYIKSHDFMPFELFFFCSLFGLCFTGKNDMVIYASVLTSILRIRLGNYD